MIGFQYPSKPHDRRHGPSGYTDYNSYRDWLRDEFTFRCVYCLHRERWYDRGGTFHIEHSVPVTEDKTKECEYANLLYACASCNEAKNAILGVPDPCKVAFSKCLRVLPNGRIEVLNADGRKLEQVLRLNNDKNVRHRAQMIGILKALETKSPELYEQLMGFPDDLPDLQRKRVPVNLKPEGIVKCHFALRARGELPSTY